MSKFIYLAYGTNMPSRLLSKRTWLRDGLKFMGVGWLSNMRLAFGSGGYATVLQASGCRVPVCAYEISLEDKCILDNYEGCPVYYKCEYIEFEPDNLNVWRLKYPDYKIFEDEYLFGKIYIMTSGHQIETPNRIAHQAAIEGYEEYGIDIKYLNEAIEWSEKNRGTLIMEGKDYGNE